MEVTWRDSADCARTTARRACWTKHERYTVIFIAFRFRYGGDVRMQMLRCSPLIEKKKTETRKHTQDLMAHVICDRTKNIEHCYQLWLEGTSTKLTGSHNHRTYRTWTCPSIDHWLNKNIAYGQDCVSVDFKRVAGVNSDSSSFANATQFEWFLEKKKYSVIIVCLTNSVDGHHTNAAYHSMYCVYTYVTTSEDDSK